MFIRCVNYSKHKFLHLEARPWFLILMMLRYYRCALKSLDPIVEFTEKGYPLNSVNYYCITLSKRCYIRTTVSVRQECLMFVGTKKQVSNWNLIIDVSLLSVLYQLHWNLFFFFIYFIIATSFAYFSSLPDDINLYNKNNNNYLLTKRPQCLHINSATKFLWAGLHILEVETVGSETSVGFCGHISGTCAQSICNHWKKETVAAIKIMWVWGIYFNLCSESI